MVRSQDVNPVRSKAEHLIGRPVTLQLKPGDPTRIVGPEFGGVLLAVDDYGVDLGRPLPRVPWEWIEDVRYSGVGSV